MPLYGKETDTLANKVFYCCYNLLFCIPLEWSILSAILFNII